MNTHGYVVLSAVRAAEPTTIVLPQMSANEQQPKHVTFCYVYLAHSSPKQVTSASALRIPQTKISSDRTRFKSCPKSVQPSIGRSSQQFRLNPVSREELNKLLDAGA